MTGIQRYITHKSGEEISLYVFSLLLVLVGLVALAAWQRDALGVYLVLGGVAFVLFAAWRVETIPFLFLSYLSFIPAKHYAEYFSIFPFYFYLKLVPVFVLAMVIVNWVDIVASGKNTLDQQRHKDITGTAVLSYLVFYIFIILIGLSKSNNIIFIISEACYLSLFITYFFWRSYFRRKDNELYWMKLLVVIGLFVALEYFAMVALTFKDIVTFVIERSLTRQAQITLAGIPLAAAFMLGTRRRIINVAMAILLFLFFIQVFLSQQRTLWIVTAFSVFLFFTLFTFRRGFSRRAFLVWSISILVIGAIFVGIILFAVWYFHIDISTLLKRWQDVGNLTDQSFRMRILDTRNALKLMHGHWLFGMGAGSSMYTIPTGMQFFFFDMSYAVLLMKGGLLLPLLLVFTYLRGMYEGYKLFRRSSTIQMRLIGAAVITTFAGQMISGLVSVSTIYYRYIFVWMLLVAAARTLNEKRETAELSGTNPELEGVR